MQDNPGDFWHTQICRHNWHNQVDLQEKTMNKKSRSRNMLIALGLLLFLSSGVMARDVNLSMVYTNALGEKLPFEIFEKKTWKPAADARFVKVHMYFDEPITVKKYTIDTCGLELAQSPTVFFNFDEWIFNLAANKSGNQDERYPDFDNKIYSGSEEMDNTYHSFPKVRSFTINFNNNMNFSVCGIHIFNENDEEYTIKTPARIQADVKASSTLGPDSAYGVVNLFDSRFEFGWASDAKSKDVQIDLNFKDRQNVQKILIWNGYQRSDKHCFENSRVKTLVLKGDGNYSEEIQIADQLGSQIIPLLKPFSGKKLTLYVKDAYNGKTYKDLVISEIRFFNGKEWFLVDPFEKMTRQIKDTRNIFSNAGFDKVLNQSFAGTDVDKDNNFSASNYTLRLRADGSFYLDGGSDNYTKAIQKYYFALGNFDIVESKKGQLRLRLFGLFYLTEKELNMDCNGCGRDCNRTPKDTDPKYMIFQEFVTMTPNDKGGYTVKNESNGKNLPFSIMQLKDETEDTDEEPVESTDESDESSSGDNI